MRLKTELAGVVLGVVALNLLLVFAAIAMFGRMGPAIERILVRNDATIASAEAVLGVLARTPLTRLSDVDRRRVTDAVDHVRGNITEGGEGDVVRAIDAHLEPVLAGDAAHRGALVRELQELIAVNRAAMRRDDHEARRLGGAGAWVAAVVGLLSLGLGMFLCRSLGLRIVRPLLELRQVLLAAQAGDPFRRCTSHRAPVEIRETLAAVNELVDALTPARGDAEFAAGPPAVTPGAGAS